MKLITKDNDSKNILQTKCVEVTNKSETIDIFKGMRRILEETKGLGISANQVGYTKRIFIFRNNKGNFENVINPIVFETSDKLISMSEACLSYPGESKVIQRPKSIKVQFENDGRVITRRLVNLEARIFLHELDHLNGLCSVANDD